MVLAQGLLRAWAMKIARHQSRDEESDRGACPSAGRDHASHLG